MRTTLKRSGIASPLEGEESLQKKQRRHYAAKPDFSFDLRGFDGGKQAEVAGIRDFVLHLLLGSKCPPWIQAEHRENISRVVVLMVPGLLPDSFGLPPLEPTRAIPVQLKNPKDAPENRLPGTTSLFAHYCPIRSAAHRTKIHNPYRVLVNAPLTAEQKEQRMLEVDQKAAKGISLTSLLLSEEGMREAGYTIPSYGVSGLPSACLPPKGIKEWRRGSDIETPRAAGRRGLTTLFAIDCEMVITREGLSELARVTVVDETGSTVYDKLVKPEYPVEDYLTAFSGMTEERLEGVETRLEDVQKDLARLFDYNTILCGHSLECDLKALKVRGIPRAPRRALIKLKFVHPWVIDTSVIYDHSRGPPLTPSLKWLALKWLKRVIQDQNVSKNFGHDSCEDALAALDLVKLKVIKGHAFGLFPAEMESIFDKLARADPPRASAYVDRADKFLKINGAGCKTTKARSSDRGVANAVADLLKEHDLVIARMAGLSAARGWTTTAGVEKESIYDALTAQTELHPDSLEPSTASPSSSAEDREESLATAHESIDKSITKLHAALPDCTAFIICSLGSQDIRYQLLAKRKASFDQFWKTKDSLSPEELSAAWARERWSAEDDRELQAAVARARMGMSLFCVRKADIPEAPDSEPQIITLHTVA